MAHGNELSEKLGYRLMQGRLGIYDRYRSHNTVLDKSLSGVQNQNSRAMCDGGNFQERMATNKRRTLDRVVWFSYQGADVKKVDSTANHTVRALINPNKLKPEYDDKVISIPYEHDFHPGDVFEWEGTGTYWLIYLQDLTELGYFKGDVRKCSHEIAWQDDTGSHKTFAAIRGPVETKINAIQKGGIDTNVPNYSLNILLPKTEETMKYFQRYTRFYLSGDERKVCWRVEGMDWLSMPGVIEINATEYYSNPIEDDIENGIVGSLVTEPVNPNTRFIDNTIEGETFIKPKKEYEYTYNGNLRGKWTVDKDVPVQLTADGNKVKVRWLNTYSGQFDLYYAGAYKKTIVVESLF